MRQWRLIALDLDGTLLDPEGKISEENKKWIQKARQSGLRITIATGRPLRMTRFYRDMLNIQEPYVVANGSEVWAPPNRLLARHTLAIEDVEFLLDVAKKRGVHFWSSIVDHALPPGYFPDDASRYQWLKFGFQNDDLTVINKIWNQLIAYGKVEVSSSDPTNIEVNPLGVTKATGLQKVCETLGIRPEQVVTIGDGLNDIPMMRWAGLAIAVENAHPRVKAIADEITAHHARHGVAEAIKKLL